MKRLRRICLQGGLIVAVLGLLTSKAEDAGAAPPTELRLGLVNSLFRDTPKAMIQILAQPLKTLMETQTGMAGQLESSADPQVLGKQLQDNQIDLAVFHGFEFAWARLKYPELQPLLTINNPQHFQAHLIVARDSKYKSCADLKGKTVALPRRSREHLHLFLERRCAGGKAAKEFFGKIARPTDAEDALDDVVEAMVPAALVDYGQLEAYRKAKPEQFAKLRVLLKSETFPTGVIAYHGGALNEDTVQRIRAGLISANQTKQGRELLTLCRMVGFESPPDDFNQTLAAFAKLYPPPAPK
jgi:ABC-type phosphate/phosphonate transport system substrate-binding protein